MASAATFKGATGRVLTYAQLVEQTRRFAAGLSRGGIRQRWVHPRNVNLTQLAQEARFDQLANPPVAL